MKIADAMATVFEESGDDYVMRETRFCFQNAANYSGLIQWHPTPGLVYIRMLTACANSKLFNTYNVPIPGKRVRICYLKSKDVVI